MENKAIGSYYKVSPIIPLIVVLNKLQAYILPDCVLKNVDDSDILLSCTSKITFQRPQSSV